MKRKGMERGFGKEVGEVKEAKGRGRENDGRGDVDEKGRGGLWPPTLAARSCIVDGHLKMVISLTVFGVSVTNLNEPPRALATSTIAWVRS